VLPKWLLQAGTTDQQVILAGTLYVVPLMLCSCQASIHSTPASTLGPGRHGGAGLGLHYSLS
jgi:hypothetical protein